MYALLYGGIRAYPPLRVRNPVQGRLALIERLVLMELLNPTFLEFGHTNSTTVAICDNVKFELRLHSSCICQTVQNFKLE